MASRYFKVFQFTGGKGDKGLKPISITGVKPKLGSKGTEAYKKKLGVKKR
jgi:hypothetical protein